MKKRNKFLTTMLAGVLVAGMAAGMGFNAKAADPEPNKGTEATEATVSITKDLYMDPDVATPEKKFTFEQTKVSLDDETTTAILGTMPDLTLADPTTTITTSSTAYYSDTNATESFSETKVDSSVYKDVPITSADLVHGAEGAALNWPHAGEYVYTIKESIPNPEDPTIEYSKAEYQVTVYIANGAADGDLYVASVGVKQTKNDAGTENNPIVKVNANPNSGISGQGSQFAFKNTYTPLSALQIEKKVAGTYADQTKLFPFTTTLTLPTVGKVADSYTAYICNADGTTDGTAIEFKKGTYSNTYSLKHGQYLQFGVYDSVSKKFTPNLPVGTTYTAVENRADADYILSATVKTADGTNTDATPVADTALATNVNNGTTTGNVNINTSNKVGDISNLTDTEKLAGNKVAALNKYKEVTPTGILINNLPFILMILVAIGGIALYLVSKRRKAHK